MRLAKFFKWIFIVNILAIIYIHMQMNIYDLAYQRTAKEREIKKLTETKGDVTHKILTLTSAQHLGSNVLDKNKDMKFARSEQIMEVSVSEESALKTSLAQKSPPAQSNLLLSLLSLYTNEPKAQADRSR